MSPLLETTHAPSMFEPCSTVTRLAASTRCVTGVALCKALVRAHSADQPKAAEFTACPWKRSSLEPPRRMQIGASNLKVTGIGAAVLCIGLGLARAAGANGRTLM